MASLKRTRVGEFRIEAALTLGRLQQLRDVGELNSCVRGVDDCFSECPKLHVVKAYQKLIDNGNAFYPAQTMEKVTYPQDTWVRIYNEAGRFYGIYAYEENKHWYKPVKMFLSE